MGLRDLLKKKDDISERGHSDPDTVGRLAAPEFTFIRSDTHTQEIITPPSIHHDHDMTDNSGYLSATSPSSSSKNHRGFDVFRSNRNRSTSDVSSTSSVGASGDARKRRLSQRLHLSRHPSTSDIVPQNLPEIRVPNEADDLESQVEWEKRATILARENEKHRSRPVSPTRVSPGTAKTATFAVPAVVGVLGAGALDAPKSDGVVSSKKTDENIQEAIRLHEEGELESSTRLFGILADPNGANNPLSQVLYGLALRHGWGCEPDPGRAVTFLTKAASNAAVVENLALLSGQKKGGAAKGELVLAIFELANCFRNGWGIPKDPVAAKHYYETAANLGDADAMNEVAWCYLEGFGCKKDKYAAARYYRLAEKNGNKTLGNSWAPPACPSVASGQIPQLSEWTFCALLHAQSYVSIFLGSRIPFWECGADWAEMGICDEEP
ncbi:hypothetical protein MKZ38_010053 [Zalerion maritima]|uniref:HCP-like protein n=1 Tax=Zalerion maritima TaxID=339359 RepID=A0AAD5WMY8_9PEZI|nr:hypothetical protein MKZ38_010053 [Zalerion maritima]